MALVDVWLSKHHLQLQLIDPAGGQHKLKGGGCWPGLTGEKQRMPMMLSTSLIPAAQRYSAVQYILNFDPRCELQGSNSNGLYGGRREEWGWLRLLLQPTANEGDLCTAAHGYDPL